MTDFLFRYRNIVPNLSFMFVNHTRKRHMKINYFIGLIKKGTKEHSPIFFSSFLLKEIYQKTPMAGRHGQTWRDCQRHTGQRTPWEGCRGLCCATTQEPAGFGMPGVLSGSVLQGTGRNTLQLCSKERHWRTVRRDKPVCWMAGQDKRQTWEEELHEDGWGPEFRPLTGQSPVGRQPGDPLKSQKL